MFIKNFFEKSDLQIKVRVVTFILALVFVLAIFGIISYYKATVYRNSLGLITARSIEDLSDNVKNIDIELQKCIYANSNYQLSSISENLKSECEEAKINLSFLPSYEMNLEKLSKYISQTGNYASALAKISTKNRSLSRDERENLIKLKNISDSVYENLQTLLSNIDENELSSDAFTRSLFDNEKSDYDLSLSKSLNDVEEGFDNYPTLIYDGPFSDHILNKKPSLTEEKKETTINEAKKLAARYSALSQSKISFKDEEKGTLPCYIFDVEGGGRITVSKKGGYLVYFMKEKNVGEEKLTVKDAISSAKRALSRLKLGDFKESYYTRYGGVITVNLAYTENDAIFYTDLVKVSVCLDDGTISMIDARGFVMNHKKRNPVKVKYSQDKARKNLSPNLRIESCRLAVIPTYGDQEAACFEFTCKGEKDEDILVYVNAENGREEQIQIIIHTNDGDLAM